ncbi:hypothetical protein F5880DRAFT_1512448, partial [Lentinula raphanica]
NTTIEEDSTNWKFEHNPIHSSFMMRLDVAYSENQVRPVLGRPGSPRSVPQTLAEELASADEAYLSRHEFDDITIQNNAAAEETSINPLASPCQSDVQARASICLDFLAALRESVVVKHTVRLCGIISSRMTSYACSTRARYTSIAMEPVLLFERVRQSKLWEIAQSRVVNIFGTQLPSSISPGLHHSSAHPAYNSHPLERNLIPRLDAHPTILYTSSIATEFGSLFVHQWKSLKYAWSRLVDVLACLLIKYSTIIKIAFFLFAGVLLALKVKMMADRLILEISHRYLAFEFRQMLRHDAERWIIEQYFTVSEASSINGVVLSKDAHYLAVAYGICVDIWDLKVTTNTAPLAQYKPDSTIHPISFLTWSPESYRLAICYQGGLVCVVAMNVDGELSSLAVGFRLESGQAQRSRVFAAFLRDDILAVAMGRDVEIRRFFDDGNDPRWDLMSTLTVPSTPSTGIYPPDGDIRSIHLFSNNRILVSCDPDLAQNDVSPARGTILVAAAGTYQVLALGSTTAQGIFIPRDPVTRYPQTASSAKYLSDDLIIGAGIGQLVLWDVNLGNRLQNLLLRDQEVDGGPMTYHICEHFQTAYRREEDSGWIVTSHDGGKIICWKTVDVE